MEITAVMAMVDAALTFVEKAIPRIQEAANRGEVSVEQQKKVDDRMQQLRLSKCAFTRPTIQEV